MIKRLEKLCNAFGPSGLEDEVRDLIIEEIKDVCDSWYIDKVGNLIAFKKGECDTGKKIVLSSHMDEVGFMMRYFSEDGYVYFDTIGSVARAVVGGRRLVIGDNRVYGLVSAKAIHMQKAEEKGVCVPINEMYIDLGCETEEEARSLVETGDCATFVPNFELFGEGLIKSKAIDDRAGCAILIDLMKKPLPCDTYFAFVTCEENGCRGSVAVAYELKADEVYVVEATTAADTPDVAKHLSCCSVGDGVAISHMDGGTIYDKGLFEAAKAAAEKHGIKYQVKGMVAGGNDSRSYQLTGEGARVCALSVPTRNLHSACCVASISDIEETGKLLYAILEEKKG